MSRRSANTTKVFVGSLPAGTTEDELRNLFGPYGTIAECDIVNRCGFVYLENKQLAFKAIDDLNNFNFKGSRITVEKGRIKPASSRGGGVRNQRNGFPAGGGPMRGNRDHFRGGPYERRGPMPMRRDNNYGPGPGYGYDRGYDTRPPPGSMMMMAPDRRPFMDERNRYPDGNYGMYPEDRGMYSDDRPPPPPPPYDRRTLGERNNSNMMDRRPLMDAQVPPLSGGGSYTYDGRPQVDMFNRRDIPSKPMGGYNNIPRDSAYDLAYPPLQQQQRGFVGGPGPGQRRDMPPPRRY